MNRFGVNFVRYYERSRGIKESEVGIIFRVLLVVGEIGWIFDNVKVVFWMRKGFRGGWVFRI